MMMLKLIFESTTFSIFKYTFIFQSARWAWKGSSSPKNPLKHRVLGGHAPLNTILDVQMTKLRTGQDVEDDVEDTQGRMFELSRIGKLLTLRPEPWELAPA